MTFTKEHLETLLGSFHVYISATLAKDLPTVGTSRTVAALEKLLILHVADLLLYHAVPTATTGTANNDLVAALTNVLTPVREPNTKLNKHCRSTLTGIPYAADIVEGRRPTFCDGHPVIYAYHLFAAAVKVIVQMVSNPDFNVMTHVLGSAESDEAYTAMLDNQVERYTLHAELWLCAASEPTKTKYWKDAVRWATELGPNVSKVQLQHAIWLDLSYQSVGKGQLRVGIPHRSKYIGKGGNKIVICSACCSRAYCMIYKEIRDMEYKRLQYLRIVLGLGLGLEAGNLHP